MHICFARSSDFPFKPRGGGSLSKSVGKDSSGIKLVASGSSSAHASWKSSTSLDETKSGLRLCSVAKFSRMTATIRFANTKQPTN